MPDSPTFAESNDVLMCYRLFLGREPENSDVVDHHLSDRPTIWQLIRRFAESTEHEAIKINAGCLDIWRRQDGREIRVEASPAATAKILTHIERIWSDYGAEDPYYSVLTDPNYRTGFITDYLAGKFYESGSDTVSNFKFVFERNRIEIDPSWHILELGCGIGRVGEHFSREFEFYEGVDISANHLALAKTRFASRNIDNARFHLLNHAIEGNINFDAFYSSLVLQHNPPPVMCYLLDLFLAKLKPNGFAFFQLPCHLYGYTFDADRYLAGQGKSDSMEMHALPQKYVFELLYKHDLQPIEVCPFPAIGTIGISYVFFAQKKGRR
jgi:SAM-dependent methyltransferase